MCYNIAYIEKRAEEYHERYKDLLPAAFNYQESLPAELPVYYFLSGFVHPQLPVVKHDGIFMHEWGLIPAWVKDETKAKEMQGFTLNAVGETAFEKPSYRGSIPKKRCLLGVNGFYEWRDLNKVKYPYLISHASEKIFSLGCIYESWANKATGEIRNTFSIVTTPANPMMEKIHNLKKRMPLIIDRQLEEQWLDPDLTKDEIIHLIKPYNQEKMKAHTVSRNANSAKNNRNIPEIMEKVEYAELNS